MFLQALIHEILIVADTEYAKNRFHRQKKRVKEFATNTSFVLGGHSHDHITFPKNYNLKFIYCVLIPEETLCVLEYI